LLDKDGSPSPVRPIIRYPIVPPALRPLRSTVAFALVGALLGCSPIPSSAPPPGENVVVAPLLGRSGAFLTVRDAASRVEVSTATLPGLLYRITTPAGSGLAPVAAVGDGHAEVRFRATGGDGPDDVRIVLNRDVRWDLRLPAGAGETDLDLTAGRVSRLSTGGSGLIEASLPTPVGTLPVSFGEGVGSAIVSVPPPAPARVFLAGGAGPVFTPWALRTAPPAGSLLTEPGWGAAANRYAIRFSGGLGQLTVRRLLR
jgi:hypothetical protein